MSSYQPTYYSSSDSEKISIFEFLHQFTNLPAEDSPLSTFSRDILWMVLSTLEGEDFAIPTGTVQEDHSKLLLLPLASLIQKQVTLPTSESSVISWAKLQKCKVLTVYRFPGVLHKDKTFHRPMLK